MKKKLKIIGAILLPVLLVAVCFLYLMFNRFSLPRSLKHDIEKIVKNNYGLDLLFDDFVVDLPQNRFMVSSFSVSVSDKSPFISIDNTTFQLASGTAFIDMLSNKAVLDKIVIKDLKYDFLAPQLAEASGAFQIPPILANEVLLNGFVINTRYGRFDLSSNTAELKKDGSLAHVNFSIPNGPFGIKTFSKSSIDLETGIASIALSVSHDNLADFSPLEVYASEKNISLDNGSFSLVLDYAANLVDRINDPLKNLSEFFNRDVKGKLEIKDLEFSWLGLRFKGNVRANRSIDSVWEYQIDGKFGSGSIKVDGKFLGARGDMSDFLASFYIKDFKPTKENLIALGLPDFDYLPGSVGIKGVLDGDLSKVTGSGSFLATNWMVSGKKIDKAFTNWELGNDLSFKTDGLLNTSLGKLNVSSNLWLGGEKRMKGKLEGRFKDVDLKDIGSMLEIPLEGKCSGPFTLDFDLLDLLKSRYSLDVEVNDGAFQSFKTKLIKAKVSGLGRDWKIYNPQAWMEDGGQILLNGYIATSTLDVNVKITDVNLVSFALPSNIASGCANMEAKVKGNLYAPEVFGSLWGKNIIIMDFPLTSFKCEFSIKDSVLDLSPIAVRPVDGSSLDGYCAIDLKTSKILNARVNFQKFCLELLRPYFPVKISSKDMDGVFNGYITYCRNAGDNVWSVYLDGRSLLLAEQDIDSVYVELEGLNNQATLKSFFLRAFGGKMNLTGQFVNVDKFAGSIEGENMKFDRMEFLKPLIPNFTGSLDFQGDIDWNGRNKKGNFTVFANNLKSGERDLGNYGGEIIVDDEKLEIVNGEFDKLGIKIGGDIIWGARQPYQIKLGLNNVDFAFIPQAHGLKAFDNGCILVDGSCVVQGDLASYTPDFIDMNLNKIRIQKDDDVILSNKPMRIVYQNGTAELRSLELKYRLGVLSLEGIVSPNKNVAVVIEGDNFSAKALGSLFGLKGIDYDADVSMDARVFGTTDNIKYSSQMEMKNLKIDGREIPEVQAKFNGDSKCLRLEETFVKLKNSSFEAKGSVELDNFVPKKLNIKLSIPESPIKDLSEYAPNLIKSADGKILARLNINGNPSNPEITGDLHLAAKSIQLTSMKKPFTDVVFDMTTDDMVTTVNTLRANMGKGLIQGYGTIDFKNASGSLDVHARAEKVDLPFLTLDIYNASASIDLSGNIYNPDIKGYLYVPRGKLGLSSALFPKPSSQNSIFETLKYDFTIEVPRNFWVKNTFFNAEVKGKCSVIGDLENFKIDGGISTIQGKIFFKQRRFKIQNGEINFGGVDNSLDPYIYVKSEGQVYSTKIFLTLQGNLSNFKPHVYSTPPMSEGDIISLLAFGRDLGSAMNSDSKELFENEVLEGLKNSYLSSLIGDSISSALNLDELYLTSNFNRGMGKSLSYVRIGKYLSDRVFMAYEGTMTDDRDESYIFEYRLPKGIVFSVEFKEPEKVQTYGFRYDWQF